MPKSVENTDLQGLVTITTPSDVISYKTIDDQVKKKAIENGFEILDTRYFITPSGQAAVGIYHLKSDDVTNTKPVILWSHAYDRTVKFKCEIGGYNITNDAYFIGNDHSGYTTDYTKSSEDRALECINVKISNMTKTHQKLELELESLKDTSYSKEHYAKLMGTLYFDDVLSSSQLIKIKADMKDMSLYDLNAITCKTMVGSHPKSWIDQQVNFHNTMLSEIQEKEEEDIPVVDPNQLNLLDAIEEQVATSPCAAHDLTQTDDEDTSDDVKFNEESDTVTIEDGILIGSIDEEGNYEGFPELEGPISELQEALTEIDAETIEETHEFPEPPSDIPVYDHNLAGEAMDDLTINNDINVDETDIDVLPLEEQVAGETIQPITVEEKAISAPPIVDEPVAEVKEESESVEEDLSWVEEGPTDDPIFTPEDKKPSYDDIDFEF